MITKNCLVCDIEFTPKRKEQKLCSFKCSGEYKRLLEKRECTRDGCSNTFLVKPGDPKSYCSRSCAATVNNTGRRRNTWKYECPRCRGPKSRTSYHCSPCAIAKQQEDKVELWLSGKWSGGEVELSNYIRNYLLEQAGYACQKCSIQLFHPSDGRTCLEINHIDGDGTNHHPSNLEVLCPNCHSLTLNYRARNKGSGREYRRKNWS